VQPGTTKVAVSVMGRNSWRGKPWGDLGKQTWRGRRDVLRQIERLVTV